jgi:hypothetical protein
MVLFENADCLFMLFIVVRYSFLCYAIYCFLSHLVYGCDRHSGNVNGIGDFSPLFRCRVLRSYYCGQLSLDPCHCGQTFISPDTHRDY